MRHALALPARLRRIVVATAVLLVAAAGITSAQEAGNGMASSLHAAYHVGDAIDLRVVGYEDDLNGIYRVGADGDLELPYVGRIQAAGLSHGALTDQLTSRVWQYYINRPDVVVTPLYTINVLGYVRQPGSYHIEGGETVSDLLALAGGASDDARIQRTRVTRGEDVINQNLSRALEKGSSLDDIGIRSGDTIFIPKSQWYRSWRNWSTIISSLSLTFAIYDRVRN